LKSELIVEAREVSRFCVLNICKLFDVCRSRFYEIKSGDYFEVEDNYEVLVRDIFYKRKSKVGIRQIKMLLWREHKVVMSLKKILRVKNKYGLVTKIRRKNRYFLVKKQHEHRSVGNILNRRFNVKKKDQVYSTDITQFNYNGEKAYLTVFKDLGTREIKSYAMSKNASVYFVRKALERALYKVPKCDRNNLIIHSDQGYHYTHFDYRKLLEEHGVKQSMSRKGNCLDNAPVESFFGHLKDHIDLKECRTFADLEKMVTQEIEYYNNERPQWSLNKMPPVVYRRHLLRSGLF
jgi:putative transposase